MKAHSRSLPPFLLNILPVVLLVALPLDLVEAAGKTALTQPATAKAGSATPTNSVVALVEAPIPLSVFAIPANPKEGRNPFFPASDEAKPLPKPTPGHDFPSVVLNGITSPPKATAMINGRTFEQGESADVKLRDGNRVPVRCIEIKPQSVIIEIRGQRRELKLRAGL